MDTYFGRDKSKELENKGILKRDKTMESQYNMKKETQYTQNTPPSYHSFLKTKG